MRHFTKYTVSLALLMLAGLPVAAQDENAAFYIYQNDGHFDGFFYDEVEKISYSFLDTLGIEHDEVVSQEVVTRDSTYRIMLSAIDSVGFAQPEIKYNPRLRIYDRFNTYDSSINKDWEFWVQCLPQIEETLGHPVEKPYFRFPNTPGFLSADKIPQIGDVLVSFGGINGDDPEKAWSYKVYKIEVDSKESHWSIAYLKDIDDITDIFQQFVCVEEYGFNDVGNLARRRVAGHPDLTMGTPPRKASGSWEGDLFNFGLNTNLYLYSSDNLNITVNPSISGKLHLKTVFNLSWLGDKYISITTKLNFGVGLGFSIDGKLSDFFPGGVGGLLGGVPIPATCPLIMLDIAPDCFLRGEAHVNFRLNSPKLNGSMWTKLEINNWVPSLDMGFGNSDDGSAFESVDNSTPMATMSLNGFVQGGMLFPMKFKSLPVIKKLFESEIGGQWFVGPKLAADFTLDLTTMPWNDVASYNQLKNIKASIHMLDADYEVKGTVKTAFQPGKREVTLADGSISIFPPFDASFVPEFEDAVDYDSTMLVGGKLRDCHVVAFKPTGYVIKPVDVGVAVFNVKEDNTIDYNHPLEEGKLKSYYHISEMLGQELPKDLWPKSETITYFNNRNLGDGKKKRYVPYASIAGRRYYAPKSYDFQTEPWFTASSDTWEINWDGTIKTPVVLTGYIDKVDDENPTHFNPYSNIKDYRYYPPSFLQFTGPEPAGNGKSTFTAAINFTDTSHGFGTIFEKNYHPIDTIKYGDIMSVHKEIEGTNETFDYNMPFDMKTFVLPCPIDPVIANVEVKPNNIYRAPFHLNIEKPGATIERLAVSDEFPHGGWHVYMDYNSGGMHVAFSLDIVCDKQSNKYVIKNGQLSHTGSYSDNDFYASSSVSGSFDDKVQYYWTDSGTLGDTFSVRFNLEGTYSEKDRDTVQTSFDVVIKFMFEDQ